MIYDLETSDLKSEILNHKSEMTFVTARVFVRSITRRLCARACLLEGEARSSRQLKNRVKDVTVLGGIR